MTRKRKEKEKEIGCGNYQKFCSLGEVSSSRREVGRNNNMIQRQRRHHLKNIFI